MIDFQWYLLEERVDPHAPAGGGRGSMTPDRTAWPKCGCAVGAPLAQRTRAAAF